MSRVTYDIDARELEYFRSWLGFTKVEMANAIDMSVIMYHKIIADGRDLKERWVDRLWEEFREELIKFKRGEERERNKAAKR